MTTQPLTVGFEQLKQTLVNDQTVEGFELAPIKSVPEVGTLLESLNSLFGKGESHGKRRYNPFGFSQKTGKVFLIVLESPPPPEEPEEAAVTRRKKQTYGQGILKIRYVRIS